MTRMVVYGEGTHEIGTLEEDGRQGVFRAADDMPALPRLIHRIMGQQDGVSYHCRPFKTVKHTHGKGNRWGRKVIAAMTRAHTNGFDCAVVLIDRDGCGDSERAIPMRHARDKFESLSVPTAVGTAIETFDAWMIADHAAIQRCGGSPKGVSGCPEHLKDAKQVARQAMGDCLADCYREVAKTIDLDKLAKTCPQGFGAFRADIRAHLKDVCRDGGAK